MLALLLKNELYKAALKQKLNHPFYFSVLWCFYPIFASLLELVKLFLSFGKSPMFPDVFVFCFCTTNVFREAEFQDGFKSHYGSLWFSSSVIRVKS